MSFNTIIDMLRMFTFHVRSEEKVEDVVFKEFDERLQSVDGEILYGPCVMTDSGDKPEEDFETDF
jgi:hypothetical protein